MSYEDELSDTEIALQIHDELRKKGIITKYVIDYRTANIVIELNHVYKDKKINLHIKDYPNIAKLREGLEKFLVKKKGIPEDEARLIADVIDNNSDDFNDGYFAYNNEEKEVGQEKKNRDKKNNNGSRSN